MSNKFFAPIRMESQFLDTKLHTVIFQSAGANASVTDGLIVALGDFVNDPVYTKAYTRAAGVATNVIDINTRTAVVPTAVTATGVCVIDLANVSTAVNGDLTYRIGARTIGLVADAGVPVRARYLVKDDVMTFGDGCFVTAPTLSKFAILTANAGTLTPADTAPASGTYFKVVRKETISQGVNANAVGYTLLCVNN